MLKAISDPEKTTTEDLALQADYIPLNANDDADTGLFHIYLVCIMG
jgi:hypothetical protein